MPNPRKSPRANFLPYEDGDYFVTLCVDDMTVHHFGEVFNGEMRLSPLGRFAESQLSQAAQFTQAVEVPVFTVMPNHIHAIVRIQSPDDGSIRYKGLDAGDFRNPNDTQRPGVPDTRKVPALSRYITSFKGAVTKHAQACGIALKWQPRYHDHKICNNHDGNNIAQYILTNPQRWLSDCFHN